jgi:hypothetical protein
MGAAVWRGSVEIVQLQLDGGARTNESAFVAAVKYCSLDIVQLLLRSGARVTQGVIESAVELAIPSWFCFFSTPSQIA